MNYEKLLSALYKSWCPESSTIYEKANPSKGQCSVTAIVVNRNFGGRILKTKYEGCWHFYNLVEGEIYDFTSDQFGSKIEYQDIQSSINDALNDCTESQVTVLSERFICNYNKN